MNKLNIKLWAVTGLVTGALITLLLLQVQMLNRSITTNRQIFQQKLDILLSEVGETFRKNETAATQLPEWLHVDSEDKLRATMSEVIDGVLNQYNLPVSYEYGIYKHDLHQSGVFQLVKGSANSLQSTIQQNCKDISERNFAMTSLTCGHHYGDENKYHLAIFFSGKNDYILSQAGSSIVVSFLLMVLLGSAFAFLIYMLQRQKRISEIKSDFINNLTHEFKTPIFSIELAAGILRKSDGAKVSGKFLNYINVISAETGRLRTQVDKILQMALVDSGNFQLERKPIDLNELIRAVVRHFELIVEEKGGHITLHLESTSPIIYADDLHLRNVIHNLVDNAIKYNANAPFITLTTRDVPDGVSFSVHDNGIGMPSTVQQQIFQKFFRAQTGDVHTVKGFGLGLSYVKQIIDAHKGVINLKSAENLGSEFIIYLPAAW